MGGSARCPPLDGRYNAEEPLTYGIRIRSFRTGSNGKSRDREGINAS